ncbi:peptidase [Treponema zuelzerae]|uniref:Peptidase n=1 Tax=Teretinema zuelzerae TaxID=156 RepID=A0AAE3EFK0_9SPIR|nr:peptidase [Teretinema zuelzerae]MCD1653597.1 peptidase [Teretinema zuelzerae]
MFYRTKEMNRYERIGHKSLMEFLRKHTGTGGKLREEIELVSSGILMKDADHAGNTGDTFHWIFSTYDSDRVDERIDQNGWDLEHYLMNPVVLWAHNHCIPAIAVASDVEAKDTLTGTIRFNDKAYDEFGWGIGERVKNGIIRSGSVGLRLLEVEFIDHRHNPEEKCDVIFRKQELLEFSICNVPANPFALQMDSLQTSSQGESDPTGLSLQDRTGTNRKTSFWPLTNDSLYGGIHGR